MKLVDFIDMYNFEACNSQEELSEEVLLELKGIVKNLIESLVDEDEVAEVEFIDKHGRIQIKKEVVNE